jgi:cytochrome bd ubiquinol oxidase subunit II
VIPLFYAFAALALAAYVVLDGFDLGAGALHLWVARSDRERREVLGAIGPWWDGNEVWLIAAGGTLFVAFPTALAVAFSGFYLAMFLVVWALILRGVAIELRSHVASPLWRAFWDFVFAAASVGLALLFGVALGNLLRGVPLAGDGWFTLALFTSFSPREPVGLLDVYTVLVGLVSTVALMHHGALFLAWKTSGEVNTRARLAASRLLPVLGALLAGAFATTALVVDLVPSTGGAALVFLSVAALGASAWLRRRGKELGAFAASASFLALALAGVGATLYPTLLRSVDHAHDLTAQAAAAGAYALGTAAPWYAVALALVGGYFANLMRIHKGKVTAAGDGEGY